ncbi:MAG: hypothetical protein ACJ8F1_24835 [Polyangia bacterium]
MNARGRELAVGLALSGLVALLAQGGCAESTPVDFVLEPDGGATTATGGTGGSATGSGGSNATGGTVGSGGQTSSGGTQGTGGLSATGGTVGTGGVRGTGGATSTGGVTGTGGVMGTGGARATGGTTGSGGTRATGGTTGNGGAGGSAAPTFTQIYQTILSVSCSGSQCHSPGTQGGVSFASQSSAYSAVHSRVVAGNANGSSLYTLVNGGRMPPGGKLPAAQLSMIAAWINAGAPNN